MVGDEGAGEAEEPGVGVWGSVVAAGQAPVSGDPGQGAFDDPSSGAEPVFRVDADPGDAGCDAPLVELAAERGDVVGLVSVELVGSSSAWTAAGPYRGDTPDQGHERLAVVGVRRADAGDQRQPGRVGQYVDLRARFASVDRVWPGQIPPFSARTLIESITERDQSIRPSCPSSSRIAR